MVVKRIVKIHALHTQAFCFSLKRQAINIAVRTVVIIHTPLICTREAKDKTVHSNTDTQNTHTRTLSEPACKTSLPLHPGMHVGCEWRAAHPLIAGDRNGEGKKKKKRKKGKTTSRVTQCTGAVRTLEERL